MNFNSIYGSLFKASPKDNIFNLEHLTKKNFPDFFIKLLSKSKNHKQGLNDIKNNNNTHLIIKEQNKNKSEANNFIINTKLIKSNSDFFQRKKINELSKRKLSESSLINKRENRSKNDGYLELTKKDLIKEKDNDIFENINFNNNKNISKFKSQFNNNINKSIGNRKKISDFPNLKSRKPFKFNDKQRYQKKFKENYSKLRNFLNHLYFIKKKYKLYNTLSPNLILSNTKDNVSPDSKVNSFKEQVNDLISKFKNINEIEDKNSVNLYIVNICSPINNFDKDILSLSRSVFFNKFNSEKKSNRIIHNNSNSFNILSNNQRKNNKISPVIKKTNNIKYNTIFNQKRNINKIIKNVKKYNKNTFDYETSQKKNRNGSNPLLIKSKSINEINYIKHIENRIKNYNLLSKALNQNKNAVKLFSLIDLNVFKQQFSIEGEIEKLLSKKIIEIYFNTYQKIDLSKNSIFLSKDRYYYKLNRMYYDQISTYMEHRVNWELIENNSDDDEYSYDEKKVRVNFEWRYYSNKLYYKKYIYNSSYPLKKICVINLFEKNYEIGNKKKMFIHLISYCDKVNLNAFNYVPFTIIINNTRFLEDELDSFKEIFNFIDFQNKKEINIKNENGIIINRKYSQQFWYDDKIESLQKQYIYINKNFLSHKNYWILKPTDLYQGKCIEISNSFEEISKKCKKLFCGVDKRVKPDLEIEHSFNSNEYIHNNNNEILTSSMEEQNDDTLIIKRKKKSNIYISNEIIIQKYLDSPLLYRKRKFDIRCFVLVDWNLNVFFCKEGHLKASSFIYDINNINKFIHITNHSFQKKSNKFEQFECGNEISYNDFKNYLIEENISLDNFSKIINKMKFLVKLSFKSVGEKLMKTPNVLCFELFGYDFIVDREFNPWILEINNNPGLSISSPVIEKIIPRMMDDAFRLTIDKIFNTQYSSDCIDKNGNYKTKYQLDGYNDSENIFEFLCNIKDNN